MKLKDRLSNLMWYLFGSLWINKYKNVSKSNILVNSYFNPTVEGFCYSQENQGKSKSQTENSYKCFGVFMFGIAIFGVVCLIFNI